jgi:Tfp pilus assembly protein PilO
MSRLQAMLMHCDPRRLALWLTLGLLVLGAGTWQFLLREQVQDYRTLVSERGQSADEVARERVGLDGSVLAPTESDVARLESELYGSTPAVPVSQMASHVIGLLDGLADRFSVRLAGVKPGATGEVLGFTEVPFDVQVHGEYPRLIAWLEAAEKGLRPLVVKQFRIEPVADGDELRMELRVVSYRAPRVSSS